MKNLKFVLISSCLFVSGIDAMRYDLEDAIDPSQVDQDQHNHERKRDEEDRVALSLTLPSEDSDQTLRSEIELRSPNSDKASVDSLVNFYRLLRKKDLATGAAVAHSRHADKVFDHQGIIGSHEGRIKQLEILIHKFEETLNQAIGGFNQGKELLLKQLDELKTEIKDISALSLMLNANQENEKQRIDRLENVLDLRIANLERQANYMRAFIDMLANPLEAARAIDEYYTRKSELIFLASLGGWMTNNAIIKAVGATPILGFPLKHFVSAVSLPLKLTLAANLGLSSYKLTQKYSYIKNYKKSIFAGTCSVATIAAGFLSYKKYLQVAKFLSEMPISL